jgi:site-specific recombinase XerD
MNSPSLRLIKSPHNVPTPVSFANKLSDHHAILEGYLDTHVMRNHSDSTIQHESRFLKGWFEGYVVSDPDHPDGERQLLIWEAMAPVSGRERVVAFSKGMVASGLKPTTRSTYLGYLRRLFDYVLEESVIPGTQESVTNKYGPIEQPVSRYDYPVHAIDHEEEGLVLTGAGLYNFYNFVRTVYIANNQKKIPARRDYTMIVVAAESGLRIDEICHLDALDIHRDLFYEDNVIQTRYGKATNGSGKRIRKTIFTPFAKATVRVYEDHVRPSFPNAKSNPALFLTESGDRINTKTAWRHLHDIVRAARAAGLDLPPKLSWHSLRKSFATNFMEQYPDKIWLLMKMMGHQNPGTLHRYVLHPQAYYEDVINDTARDLLSKHTCS